MLKETAYELAYELADVSQRYQATTASSFSLQRLSVVVQRFDFIARQYHSLSADDHPD